MLGELSNAQMEHVLNSQVIGRIGCGDRKKIYVVPISYAFHKGYIYAHSREGTKIKLMRKNPEVCFEVDVMENMGNWRSVIIWGHYEELKTEKEQKSGMNILVERLSPFITSETVKSPTKPVSHPPEIVEKDMKAVVYRIKITKMTGRYEKVSTPGKT